MPRQRVNTSIAGLGKQVTNVEGIPGQKRAANGHVKSTFGLNFEFALSLQRLQIIFHHFSRKKRTNFAFADTSTETVCRGGLSGLDRKT